jgi:hypothetical protein
MSYIRPVKTRGECQQQYRYTIDTLTDTKRAKIGIILHKLKSNYVEKRHLETNDYNLYLILNI